MKHTQEMARYLVHLLQHTVCGDAALIGSLSKGSASSEHDIDVLLPGMK